MSMWFEGSIQSLSEFLGARSIKGWTWQPFVVEDKLYYMVYYGEDATLTLGTTPDTVNIEITMNCLLRRIQWISDDATAKDFKFSVILTKFESLILDLITETTNTDVNGDDGGQFGENYPLPKGSKIRLVMANYTAGKYFYPIVFLEVGKMIK